jgi:hypothetical protein
LRRAEEDKLEDVLVSIREVQSPTEAKPHLASILVSWLPLPRSDSTSCLTVHCVVLVVAL